MIPFKEKLLIKVRMPDKPVKFGVKLFMLCDSKTGYCKNFTMYAGKDDRAVGNVSKTGAVVTELVQDLLHSNHQLYMDNFYTSPICFKLLKDRGILAAGTSRIILPRNSNVRNFLSVGKLLGSVGLTVLLSDGRTGKMYMLWFEFIFWFNFC